MLDTNAVSAFLKRLSPRLDGWVREQRCCLSAIVVAEIRYGLEKRPAAMQLHALVEAALAAVNGLRDQGTGEVTVKSLQEYHGR